MDTVQPNNNSPLATEAPSSSLGLSFWLITVAILTTCFFLTLYRNEIWRSERTLWDDVVAKSPDKPGGHINLAGIHAKDGNLPLAVKEYQIAAQLASDRYKAGGNVRDRELLALAQSNLGMLLLKSSNPQDRATGLEALRATLTVWPNFPAAALPLADYEYQQKNYFQAIQMITGSLNAGVGSGFPQVGKMYYVRASAFCEIGALPQANQDFYTAAHTDADIPLTLCQKGER